MSEHKQTLFGGHIEFQGIGFGSKEKDEKAAKATKDAVKHHYEK